MLKRTFDPNRAYRVVVYLRMSSRRQNQRSPDQQLAEIKRVLKALGYNWIIVEVYRDEARTGQLQRNRPNYQKMLRDIKSGVVKIDLILCDTLERFGRVDELPVIRKQLYERNGVLILTADSSFADPTTVSGRALGVVESIRATEDGRVKAHNVLRGKRDAAELGHWPGGLPPFGLALKTFFKDLNGRQEADYCTLVHNPETAWIMQSLFTQARATGWGQSLLCKWLNGSPEIPEKFKPFQASTVGYWLNNPIYIGELRWAWNSTGIVDDKRVKQRNADEDVIRIAGFCEPLVDRETWNDVQLMRSARRQVFEHARFLKKGLNEKQIEPLAPGLAYKYLLSGLVKCGHCNRSMVASASPEYTTKDGVTKRYVGYVCTGLCSKLCENSCRPQEDWLRRNVIDRIRDRFLGPALRSTDDDSTVGNEILGDSSLSELLDEVRKEYRRSNDNHKNSTPLIEQEINDLDMKMRGWNQSLGKPDLDPRLRDALQNDWLIASDRKQALEAMVYEERHKAEQIEELVDPKQVICRLKRLADVLAGDNVTLGNLELSFFIDRIDCYADGRVVLRTCKLGALVDTVSEFVDQSHVQPAIHGPNGTHVARPRRRARVRIDDELDGREDARAAADMASDPNRFAGLSEQWFCLDEFKIPEPTFWAKEHAIEVAKERAKGLTHAKLAIDFHVSIPTIRKALEIAMTLDPTLAELPKKMQRDRWHEIHSDEVKQLKADGWSTDELAEYFKKSDTTIRSALNFLVDKDG